MGTRILRQLQSNMYDHIQNLSLSFFDEMEVGRIISRLTSDVQVVQDLMTTGSLTSISDIVGVSMIVVFMLGMDAQLAVIAFVVIPPLVLFLAWWVKRARSAFMQTRITISSLYGNLAENISGVRAIQSMSREGQNSRIFDSLNDDNRQANNKAAFLSAAVMPVLELCVAFSASSVVLFAGIQAINSNSVGRRQAVHSDHRLHGVRLPLLRPAARPDHAVHDVPARHGRRRALVRSAGHARAYLRQGRRPSS
jgi:ABC-type multidrug transport system fused ATPase/permease subunit